jgi:hypothetical protein
VADAGRLIPPGGRLALPPFRARFPWLGGDLQTLRNMLVGRPADLSPFPSRRLELPAGDGDVLLVTAHDPIGRTDRPLVLLVHGLTGCEDSFYLRASARHLLTLGYPVVRANLRGAGPSRSRCRRSYHAGRAEDLRAIIAGLEPARARGSIVPVGFSLGGNAVAKLVAERAEGSAPIRAAAIVSTPIDLAEASARIEAPRNRPYHRWLLARLKEEHAATPDLSPADSEAGRRARSLRDFDDRVTAPRNGFRDAADYYDQCSAVRYLGRADVPLLAIHARDDPWIPDRAYDAFDWAANPMLTLALAPSGGHVGFHGRDPVPWHDRVLAAFLESVLAG